MITLTADDAICQLLPEYGGAMACWNIGDQAMLRTAAPAAIAVHDPLGMASFPLVPYSNRIANAAFDWAGQSYYLSRNFAQEQHAIHGLGWLMPWQIAQVSENSALLTLDFAGSDAWPWPFMATQKITLYDHALDIKLKAQNKSNAQVPLAFGYHPYFDKAGASLQFCSNKVWMSSPDALPTHAIDLAGQFDFSNIIPVAGRDVDHCYTGWDGVTNIRWEGRKYGLEIKASPELPAAVVFIPLDGDAFCFEPVPHVNNALNMQGEQYAMPVIAPGAEYTAHIAMHAVVAGLGSDPKPLLASHPIRGE